MSKSKPSAKPKRRRLPIILGGMAVVLMIALAAVAYRPAVNRVIARGNALQESDPKAALVYYQAADLVSAASPQLVIDQAEMWLRLDQPDKAEEQVQRLPNTELAAREGSRVDLERGVVSVEGAEATKTLMERKLSKTALAAELQRMGLVRTSQRVLLSIPEAERSPTDYLLLAKADLRRGNLNQAKADLEASLKLDITNLEVHKLYKQTLEKLGQDTTQEQQRIEQLQSGNI